MLSGKVAKLTRRETENRSWRPQSQGHPSPLRRPDAVVVVLMVVLAGMNTLFTYLPDIPVPKVKAAADIAEPVDATAVQQSLPIELTSDSPRDKVVSPEAPVLTVVVATNNDVGAKEETATAPNIVAPTATGNIAETTSTDGLLSNPPLKDAKFYFERGFTLYRNGDFAAALADFDLAVRLDPNFESAYIDRGITLYRMREFERAFADVAQAIHIENSHQMASPPLPRASPRLSEK